MNKDDWITYSLTKSLIKFAKTNKKIVVLDADLADDLGLYQFAQKFPKRFIQNGIAEQDMVSMAGTLALTGLLPVVNSFASFMTARANEQIYNNATENTKIIYLNLYSGLLPAGAGKSHQSLRDISALSSIPNFKIYHPLNFLETYQILKNCIYNEKFSSAIRLNIGPPPKQILKYAKNITFKKGFGYDLIKGKDVLIFCYGQYIINEVIEANFILRRKKIECNITNLSSINFFNMNWLRRKINNFKHILVIDDHNEVGGLADNLISKLAVNKLLNNKNIIKLGVKEFPKCGNTREVLNYHKLDAKSISNKIYKSFKYENKN